jgi:DNA-binding beta-propeller fold protein YncE
MSITSDGISRLFITSMWGRITVTSLEGRELYSFGGPGSKLEGQLLEPSGIFYYGGRLYVIDSWYNHLLVLTPEGELVDVYGQSGAGVKQFNEPRGVYVHHGLIYVSDSGNGRVQVLGPNGIYLTELGVKGSRSEKLQTPTDIVIRDSGITYVVDEMENWVKRYNLRGDFLGVLTGLRSPVSIAFVGEGLVVPDSDEGLLRIFSSRDSPLGTLGPWGNGGTPFLKISGVCSVGDIQYASDYEANEIKVFRAPGIKQKKDDKKPFIIPSAEQMREITAPGLVPGKLERASDGRLYVLDRDTGRILRLGRDDDAVIVGPDGCFASSFTVGAQGHIYCLDAMKEKVVVSAADGSIVNEFHLKSPGVEMPGIIKPVDIGVSSSGEIFIADRGIGDILVYGAEGDYQAPLGQGGTSFYIQDPVALRVSVKDMIYVADAANRKVYIYSRTGRLIRELWDIEDVRMPVGLAVSKGYIYMLDVERPDIKVFNSKGMFVMSFGSRGDGKGEFLSPVSVEVDEEGYLLVSDAGNRRIQKLGMQISPEYTEMMWEVKSVRQTEASKGGGQK